MRSPIPPHLVSAADESQEESIEQHQLPTASDEIFVDSKLSVGGHGELEEVRVIAALAQHHPDIGHLDVSGRQFDHWSVGGKVIVRAKYMYKCI